jgi:mannose-1-phosphate guanylyltransferase/mannose-1-phosphate guanylyltransferase/mannose-6-phosphate isomerase
MRDAGVAFAAWIWAYDIDVNHQSDKPVMACLRAIRSSSGARATPRIEPQCRDIQPIFGMTPPGPCDKHRDCACPAKVRRASSGRKFLHPVTMIVPVILCGGSGTRLWPRSRKSMPKPFLPLIGETTLFTATALRCSAQAGFADPVVVAGAAHVALVESQLPDAGRGTVIVEPEGRNTAAAIALAAAYLPADAVMLVCPSDHHIGDWAAFQAAAAAAAALAAQDWLVSFGIAATTPETGFGYLKQGEPIAGTPGYRVARFVEKPDLARATAFLAEGGYSWNGGIFAFRAGAYLAELAQHRPDIADAVRAAMAAGHAQGHRIYPDAGLFGAIAGESVDYAVMEKTVRAAMVPVSMQWSDIGNWQALYEALPHDAQGNSVRGTAELVECRNVMVDSDGPRVSVIGVEDLIVVVDGNEVLVTTAAGAQRVGKLLGAANQ